VNAGGIVFGRLAMALPAFMASEAIWWRQLVWMHQILDAGVAIDAIELCMNRLFKGVGGKQKGNGLPIHLSAGGRIEMAVQTVGI
jgi:hypothetical protein